jgi:hypothetical protein
LNRNHNVSITLNEDEYKIFVELHEELKRRSIKEPNQTETIRHAIKFTRDNIDIPELAEDLKRKLETEKRKNELFEKSFIEFQNKIKL